MTHPLHCCPTTKLGYRALSLQLPSESQAGDAEFGVDRGLEKERGPILHTGGSCAPGIELERQPEHNELGLTHTCDGQQTKRVRETTSWQRRGQYADDDDDDDDESSKTKTTHCGRLGDERLFKWAKASRASERARGKRKGKNFSNFSQSGQMQLANEKQFKL